MVKKLIAAFDRFFLSTRQAKIDILSRYVQFGHNSTTDRRHTAATSLVCSVAVWLAEVAASLDLFAVIIVAHIGNYLNMG